MSKRILLVEDSEADAKLTVRALRTCGFGSDIVVARDGAAALDYLLRTGEYADPGASPRPTVVLLDLNLPKVDGFDVLRRLRAEDATKLLPVVILTSSREEEDVARGYALGANAYVRKPVEYTAFAEAARALGAFWLTINEEPPVPAEPS